jgi:hypothetical protein
MPSGFTRYYAQNVISSDPCKEEQVHWVFRGAVAFTVYTVYGLSGTSYTVTAPLASPVSHIKTLLTEILPGRVPAWWMDLVPPDRAEVLGDDEEAIDGMQLVIIDRR